VAYQLKRREPVGRAGVRLVRAELDAALSKARDPRASVDERVHKARTSLKRARAVLALLEEEAGRRAKRDDQRLRDVGRLLAPARDRFVTRQALARLGRELRQRADGAAAGGAPRLEAALRRALADDDAAARLADAVGALARARGRVGRWKIAHGRRAVARGFERSYRRARRAFASVRVGDDDVRFHEWRKAVKRLGYEVELLAEAVPEFFGALEPPLRQLGRVLGDLHDLWLLRVAVLAHGGAPALRAERDRWIDALGRRAGALREEARVLGRLLFAERPAEFARRVDASWKAWRG
jgi:CHAD domain-containing protein